MGGADTVEGLGSLYASLVAGEGTYPEGRNFTDPLQHEVDVFLADGGTASELLRLVADAVAYAGPQTRPEGCDHGGEYDEAAEGLEALSATMRIVYG
jgi:hypothetical protein